MGIIKDALPPESSDLLNYEEKARKRGLTALMVVLGLVAITSMSIIAATDAQIDTALESRVALAKKDAVQAIATAMSSNPADVSQSLKSSVQKIQGLDLEAPFSEDDLPVCNITLLRNAIFDHDNDSTTPSHNLTVGLTVEHCTDGADHLRIKNGKKSLTGSIENIDVFDEVPNLKNDYAELVLLEFPAENTADLSWMATQLPLGEAPKEMTNIALQTCGFQDGLTDKLCLTSVLQKNKYGFEVISPIMSAHGASGSPYLYLNPNNPLDKRVIGALSQIYRYTDAPYNFVASVGPDAQERVWRLIQAKVNSTKDYVDSYTQNYLSLPPTPVKP